MLVAIISRRESQPSSEYEPRSSSQTGFMSGRPSIKILKVLSLASVFHQRISSFKAYIRFIFEFYFSVLT